MKNNRPLFLRSSSTVVLTALLVLAAAPVVLEASARSRAAAPVGDPDPLVATETMRAVITKIEADGAITLQPIDTERFGENVVSVVLDETIPIRAKKKADFDGRRRLETGDLQVGHYLDVTFLQASGKVTRVKVLDKQLPDPT